MFFLVCERQNYMFFEFVRGRIICIFSLWEEELYVFKFVRDRIMYCVCDSNVGRKKKMLGYKNACNFCPFGQITEFNEFENALSAYNY